MKVFLIEVNKNNAWSATVDGREFWAGGAMNTASPKIYATEKSANRAISSSSYMGDKVRIVTATLTVDID